MGALLLSGGKGDQRDRLCLLRCNGKIIGSNTAKKS